MSFDNPEYFFLQFLLVEESKSLKKIPNSDNFSCEIGQF